MKSNTHLQKLILLLIALFFYLLVFIGYFSVATPDDFWNAFYIIKKGKPFFAPFLWSASMFLQWSGRVVVNFLVAVFTLKPLHSNWTALLHAFLFYSSLGFMFADFYKKFEIDRLSRLLFSAAMLMIIFSVGYFTLGEAVYLGSSPYVWPMVFFVMARILLNSEYAQKHPGLNYLVLFCLGNSIEFMIVPGYVLLWTIKRSKRFEKTWPLFLALTAGALLNLLSPAMFASLKSTLGVISFNPMDQLYHVELLSGTLAFLVGWKALFVIPLCFFFHLSGTVNLEDIKRKMQEDYLLAFASVCILIPRPGPVAEAIYVYFMVFFATAIFWTIQYLKRRFFQKVIPLTYHQVVLLLSLVGANYLLFINVLDAAQVRGSFLEQQRLIEYHSRGYDKRLTEEKFKEPIKEHLLFYSDITNDASAPANEAQMTYYGIDRLVTP